jgi:hypothetical protein
MIRALIGRTQRTEFSPIAPGSWRYRATRVALHPSLISGGWSVQGGLRLGSLP